MSRPTVQRWEIAVVVTLGALVPAVPFLLPRDMHWIAALPLLFAALFIWLRR